MKLRRPVHHVIFDLDGVLLDTEPLYTEASSVVAARHGKRHDWSIKGNMIGRPAREAAEYFVAALDLPISPGEYLRARDEYLLPRLARVRAMPGAEAFTRALLGRGIPMAVATSTESKLLDPKIEAHRHWFSIFSAIVCGDDPRVIAGKPAPDIFLAAASDLGAEPASCVVFEDSPAGVAGALAAGMQVVALPDAHMDSARYVGAEFIASGFGECHLSDLGI